MQFSVNDDVLTIRLGERVETTNADAVSAELDQIREANPASNMILDAEDLVYISSAGLRVILRMRKLYPDLKVINTSTEVYDIFDMTGFTEMINVEKGYRKFSVDGCTVLAEGAKGIVYRYNEDTIIKVYKNPDSLADIKRERELARKAFVLGIPTAISYDVVKVGDKFGSVFERLTAKSFSKLIVGDPENKDAYIKEFADMLRQIHHTEVSPQDMPDVKLTVRKWLDADKPFLSEAAAEKLENLIRDVPNTTNMLHCDYHTNNVMKQDGETLMIDMDTLSHGHPVFELANVHITYVGFGYYEPDMPAKFLGMPYEEAVYVWNKFLPYYLETEDPERIRTVGNAVELMSCVRLMRHFVRRGGADTEDGKRLIDFCKNKIETLLQEVDTLDVV